MTNDEIIRSYNAAKSKKRQIGILADLNACAKEDIMAIISSDRSNGAADEQESEDDNAPPSNHSKARKPSESSRLINWLYEQLDATEEQIRALEARYRELSVTLKVTEEYREVTRNAKPKANN